MYIVLYRHVHVHIKTHMSKLLKKLESDSLIFDVECVLLELVTLD